MINYGKNRVFAPTEEFGINWYRDKKMGIKCPDKFPGILEANLALEMVGNDGISFNYGLYGCRSIKISDSFVVGILIIFSGSSITNNIYRITGYILYF